MKLDPVVQRYRIIAIVTGIGLLILTFVGVPLKLAGSDAVAGPVGLVHGVLFIVYLVLTAELAFRRRWSIVRTVLTGLAGTVPFASLIVERRVVAAERAAALGAPASAAAPTP